MINAVKPPLFYATLNVFRLDRTSYKSVREYKPIGIYDKHPTDV